MKYFLEKIAELLYTEFGNTLNRHCLVFPNRRAGLYFMKYLAGYLKKPVWTPSIITVNELFTLNCDLQKAGNEILLFELYKVYIKLKSTPESFDDFYFWGDMLLNDFDDIDKYLVDASLLFRNVQDIKNIDKHFGGLTDEQVEVVKRFWINFNPDKPTGEKQGFISVWSVLNDLYTEFRSSLRNQNLAYEGMIFRELAESEDDKFISDNHFDVFHFIGFNALNECEKLIMMRLKKAGKARFYWDYDNSYFKKGKLNSAGYFLKDNLKIFGNDMPSDWNFETMVSKGADSVRRRVIEVSSDVAQVKLISQLIKELPDLTPENAHHTAVILADENLLMPVLTSLPENIGDINITMGHPLKHTLVYTLVKNLMDLHRSAIVTDGIVRFSYKDVAGVLKHSLLSPFMNVNDNEIISEITKTNLIWVPENRFLKSEYLHRIFKKPLTPSLLSDYFKDILSFIASNEKKSVAGSGIDEVERNIKNEFIYRIILSINKLEAITRNPEIKFSTNTYIRILDRILRIQSVPFSGEPLSGIQIMGMLETRALDFKNLVILSVNEGVLPVVSGGSSFIPFSLREAFGLPSVNHQESIYAYHFYRLLQRAENVTFTYNSNSEGLKTGEMSRFLIQMKYDSILKPEFQNLHFEIKTHTSIKKIIDRKKEHTEQLVSQFLDKNKERALSPSAINTWLHCRMKFYYRYVNRLKEPEKVLSDIDPAMLGNILHEIMRSLYENYRGQILSKDILNSLIRNRKILEKSVNEAILEKFNKGNGSFISGNELIVRDVLMTYILRILHTDLAIVPFAVLEMEKSFNFLLSVTSNGSQIELLTGGKIDRIDSLNNVVRIVDYKTGTVADIISSVSELFVDDRNKDYDAWLQTLLYCEAYQVNNPQSVIRPSVYKIRKLAGTLTSDKLRIKSDSGSDDVVDDYNSLRNEFITDLKEIICKIFSPDEPFTMTTDLRGKCSYCVYKELCMR
jgi:hypothetical protein